MDSKLEKSRNF